MEGGRQREKIYLTLSFSWSNMFLPLLRSTGARRARTSYWLHILIRKHVCCSEFRFLLTRLFKNSSHDFINIVFFFFCSLQLQTCWWYVPTRTLYSAFTYVHVCHEHVYHFHSHQSPHYWVVCHDVRDSDTLVCNITQWTFFCRQFKKKLMYYVGTFQERIITERVLTLDAINDLKIYASCWERKVQIINHNKLGKQRRFLINQNSSKFERNCENIFPNGFLCKTMWNRLPQSRYWSLLA